MTEQQPPQEQTAPDLSLTLPGPARPGVLQKLNPLNLFKQETPRRWVKEGQRLMEYKNYAQATIAFNRALGLDKDCADAHAGLGAVLSRKGGRSNLEAALKHYEEAIRSDPFNDQNFSISARIYEKLGLRKEATLQRKKMVIVKTLATDPTNPIANNNMGILMLQQKQVAQALAYFQKSIQYNPRYDVAFRNFASTYYQLAAAEGDEGKRRDHLEQAEAQILRALEVSESVPSLLVHCKILLLQKRYEDALARCERAEALEEANKNIYGLKKVVLERLNRMGEAQVAFDKFQMYSRD